MLQTARSKRITSRFLTYTSYSKVLQGCRLPQHRYLSYDQLPAKSVVFSGIQPTGIPHLGNWIGALKQWVKLQEYSTHLYFAIVDLHAITAPQSRSTLREWRKQTLAILLAIGLDPGRCTIFYQSDVAAHAELMWILTCISPLGYLSRMTSWKSKVTKNQETLVSTLEDAAKAKVRLGLLAYPVLQAADILVHGATYVPVGSDQRQHLEFAKECARNFNNVCGAQILVEPKAVYSPRVMSLRDPSQKMSKSHIDPRSKILLTDSYEEIHKKVKAALTDSREGITYDPSERPGISNLLSILSCLDVSEISPEEHAVSFRGHSIRAFKDHVADQIFNTLSPIQEAYKDLTRRQVGLDKLDEVATLGAQSARVNAQATMGQVREAIGF